MPFVRVKSAVKTDPQHEFDVSVAEADANKDLYVIVDREPVDDARPATYAEPPAVETKPGGQTKKGRA